MACLEFNCGHRALSNVRICAIVVSFWVLVFSMVHLSPKIVVFASSLCACMLCIWVERVCVCVCNLIQKHYYCIYYLPNKPWIDTYRHIYESSVCIQEQGFPRSIWSWLCMPNRGGNTHNNDAFSLSLSISVWMRFMQHTIFRLVWSPESILLGVVVRVSVREREMRNAVKRKIYCRQFWFDW